MSSDLWSFSLATYARPGVESACLTLQAAGVNVCLLLCGFWLAERGVACNQPRLDVLRTVTEPWDADVVRPLRSLREQWKAAAGTDVGLRDLREQVKALELQAERHLLLRLERAAVDWPQSEVTDYSAWLDGVATGVANLNRNTLLQLRVAVAGA